MFFRIESERVVQTPLLHEDGFRVVAEKTTPRNIRAILVQDFRLFLVIPYKVGDFVRFVDISQEGVSIGLEFFRSFDNQGGLANELKSVSPGGYEDKPESEFLVLKEFVPEFPDIPPYLGNVVYIHDKVSGGRYQALRIPVGEDSSESNEIEFLFLYGRVPGLPKSTRPVFRSIPPDILPDFPEGHRLRLRVCVPDRGTEKGYLFHNYLFLGILIPC